MEPTFASPYGNGTRKKPGIAIIIGIFILLLIIVYIMSKSFRHGEQPTPNAETHQTQTVNLSETEGDARLPGPFPRSIPVETAHIFESYTVDHPTTGLTQYTVNYHSSSSLATLFTTYQKYFDTYSYRITDTENLEDHKVLVGVHNNDTLTVFLTSELASSSTVYLSFLSHL